MKIPNDKESDEITEGGCQKTPVHETKEYNINSLSSCKSQTAKSHNETNEYFKSESYNPSKDIFIKGECVTINSLGTYDPMIEMKDKPKEESFFEKTKKRK